MYQDVRISEIQIIPVKPNNGLVGFTSFVLDNRYYVGSVAIFTRLNGAGYRLVYPAKRVGENNINIFHPINFETGRAIEEVINEKAAELFNENFYGSTGQ